MDDSDDEGWMRSIIQPSNIDKQAADEIERGRIELLDTAVCSERLTAAERQQRVDQISQRMHVVTEAPLPREFELVANETEAIPTHILGVPAFDELRADPHGKWYSAFESDIPAVCTDPEAYIISNLMNGTTIYMSSVVDLEYSLLRTMLLAPTEPIARACLLLLEKLLSKRPPPRTLLKEQLHGLLRICRISDTVLTQYEQNSLSNVSIIPIATEPAAPYSSSSAIIMRFQLLIKALEAYVTSWAPNAGVLKSLIVVCVRVSLDPAANALQASISQLINVCLNWFSTEGWLQVREELCKCILALDGHHHHWTHMLKLIPTFTAQGQSLAAHLAYSMMMLMAADDSWLFAAENVTVSLQRRSVNSACEENFQPERVLEIIHRLQQQRLRHYYPVYSFIWALMICCRWNELDKLQARHLNGALKDYFSRIRELGVFTPDRTEVKTLLTSARRVLSSIVGQITSITNLVGHSVPLTPTA